jgi:hypothetical protein
MLEDIPHLYFIYLFLKQMDTLFHSRTTQQSLTPSLVFYTGAYGFYTPLNYKPKCAYTFTLTPL